MKTLNEYIKESLLDDFDALDKNLDDSIEKDVKKWILDNYQIIPSSLKILKRPNKDGKLIVNAGHAIFISDSKSLTNGMFVWGKIKNQFYCARSLITSLEGAPQYVGEFFNCHGCKYLTSLEGAPEKVGGSFDCTFCKSLTSLEGSPKEVGGDFGCSHCDSLTSLEGSPKEVGKDFYCNDCKSLKSLEGAPEKIDGYFNCSNCDSLISFNGAPKEINGNFYCNHCKSLKSADLPVTTKIKGEIIDK